MTTPATSIHRPPTKTALVKCLMSVVCAVVLGQCSHVGANLILPELVIAKAHSLTLREFAEAIVWLTKMEMVFVIAKTIALGVIPSVAGLTLSSNNLNQLVQTHQDMSIVFMSKLRICQTKCLRSSATTNFLWCSPPQTAFSILR